MRPCDNEDLCEEAKGLGKAKKKWNLDYNTALISSISTFWAISDCFLSVRPSSCWVIMAIVRSTRPPVISHLRWWWFFVVLKIIQSGRKQHKQLRASLKLSTKLRLTSNSDTEICITRGPPVGTQAGGGTSLSRLIRVRRTSATGSFSKCFKKKSTKTSGGVSARYDRTWHMLRWDWFAKQQCFEKWVDCYFFTRLRSVGHHLKESSCFMWWGLKS